MNRPGPRGLTCAITVLLIAVSSIVHAEMTQMAKVTQLHVSDIRETLVKLECAGGQLPRMETAKVLLERAFDAVDSNKRIDAVLLAHKALDELETVEVPARQEQDLKTLISNVQTFISIIATEIAASVISESSQSEHQGSLDVAGKTRQSIGSHAIELKTSGCGNSNGSNAIQEPDRYPDANQIHTLNSLCGDKGRTVLSAPGGIVRRFYTYKGKGPRRFKVEVKECSSWNKDLKFGVKLVSSSRVDYEFKIKSLSGHYAGYSWSMDTEFYKTIEDYRNNDDTTVYEIEVQYLGSVGGAWMDEEWFLYVGNIHPQYLDDRSARGLEEEY